MMFDDASLGSIVLTDPILVMGEFSILGRPLKGCKIVLFEFIRSQVEFCDRIDERALAHREAPKKSRLLFSMS